MSYRKLFGEMCARHYDSGMTHDSHSQIRLDAARRPARNIIIRAELAWDDTCSAGGITAHGSAPVLALCRKLIEAGHNPATPLEAWRGSVLCLRVQSIGEAARLRMDTAKTGRPVFKRQETTARASPMRLSADQVVGGP
jgi:hypothetical protein